LDYEEYNQRMYNNPTEFEKKFPKSFVNTVRNSYLKKTHSVDINKVAAVCKKRGVTYSQYQQMESLFLAKLQRL